MKYTENLALRKPEGTDSVKVDDFNYNNDQLDSIVANISETATEANQLIKAHAEEANPHKITVEKLGLEKIDNIKQMPISGGTFTGSAFAYSTILSGPRIRNIGWSTSVPANNTGKDGDIMLILDM